MVSSTRVAACLPAPRVIPNIHSGFAVDTEALDLSAVHGILVLHGVPIFFLNVGKDGIRFWKFLLRLSLEHLAQTVAIAVQNVRHGARRRQLIFMETLCA